MRGAGQRFSLPDGRQLAYDVHGPPGGRPLLLFHGTPSSRTGWHVFGDEALAHRLDIRVIAPDRPGVGDSDLLAGRRLADWPGDVAALAGHLGLERFAVLGYSGGGPYVVACALLIPERLTAAGIVGGTGLHDTLGESAGVEPGILRLLRLARDRPQLAGRLLVVMSQLARRAPQALVARAMAILPGPDRTVVARPEVCRAVVGAFVDALRQGPQGVCLDTALMISPWGLDPRRVAATIDIWHGEEDCMVSAAAVRHLAAMLPRARMRLYPGEGHLSLLVRHREEVMAELLAMRQECGEPALLPC